MQGECQGSILVTPGLDRAVDLIQLIQTTEQGYIFLVYFGVFFFAVSNLLKIYKYLYKF